MQSLRKPTMKLNMFVKVEQTQSRRCRARVAEEEEVSRVNQVLVKKIHFMDFFHHLIWQRYHIQVYSQKQESRQVQARRQSSSQTRQAEIPGHKMGQNGRQDPWPGQVPDRRWARG